jgi:hypothetical protein
MWRFMLKIGLVMGRFWDALDALACEAFPCLVSLRSKEGGTVCGEDRALGAL